MLPGQFKLNEIITKKYECFEAHFKITAATFGKPYLLIYISSKSHLNKQMSKRHIVKRNNVKVRMNFVMGCARAKQQSFLLSCLLSLFSLTSSLTLVKKSTQLHLLCESVRVDRHYLSTGISDTGLIRSSITLFVILVNPDSDCSLSANKYVKGTANPEQKVNRSISNRGRHYHIRPQHRQQMCTNSTCDTVIYKGLGCKSSMQSWLVGPAFTTHQSIHGFCPSHCNPIQHLYWLVL